jgi:hypothetical protein
VREYVLGDVLELHSVSPERVIETCAEWAVDLEERVEVVVTEFAVIIFDVACHYEEDLERAASRWG